ncbi:ABC transporter related protein [Caldalkalibacillus thermarum TA2.A1]|uniref:ABC transporter ATP-binding protein n=1 Tax=Caldalkalibacillus thermarum (strain TA2.A1) TaxID=986075 RepID=F5L9H5_CALTT|nr:ABC transporter ATP-binding protein [Caldalkalibacillus thermarum]EGL81962.1 ABC transporter related protein [Caldalkalibacillus thermarum TA2.A1]QZT34467.1 ABC transporter ATP-binding protein [Caldalkalibacillus thermarum TA2.A1]
MAQCILQVENLHVSYGPIRALKGISLTVREREIVALLGANGAGKTTLLKTISGLLVPHQGKILFKGEDITGQDPTFIVQRKVIHVPEHRQVFGTLTVLDNLYLGAYHHYRSTGKEQIEQDLEKVFNLFPILKERKQQLAGTLSGGQQQMLAIARGVMAKPDVLLLDEPTLGLAPIVAKEVLELIQELNRSFGTTVLLIEQNIVASLKIAHRGYVIAQGEIVKEGEAQALLDDDEVKEAYLGHAVQ